MSNEISVGKRIIGGNENISYDSVKEFFDTRSKSNKKHKYNYVLCLDDNPEIAIARDAYSKEKVNDLLKLERGMRVLDVGCGVGRWGEFFCEKGLFYVGIDGSSGLIDRAYENLSAYEDKELLVGNVQSLSEYFSAEKMNKKFNVVIFSGLLMYLNDSDVVKTLNSLLPITDQNVQICIIESMSEDERLTLQGIFSEELHQNYSAIYRSKEEFKRLMEEAFEGKFTLQIDEIMDFEDGLQKKREHITLEHCMIWVRK